MTDADKELRELAEKATPGPWYSQYGEENTPAEEPPQWNGEMYITGVPGTAQYDQSSYVATVGYNGCGEADAAFIAAANPARIIELLERVEKADRVAKAARMYRGRMAGSFPHEYFCTIDDPDEQSCDCSAKELTEALRAWEAQ